MFTALLKPVTKKHIRRRADRPKEDIAFHRQCARKHAIRRAKERFNVSLTNKQFKHCEKVIRYLKGSELIGVFGTRRGKNYTELHIIKHLDNDVVVDLYAVYDYQLNCIVTFVPSIKKWPGRYV